MKTCSICNEEKPVTEFYNRKAECKLCARKRGKVRYYEKHESIREVLNKRKDNNVIVFKAFIKSYLQNSCCADCLENDWVVLEFDHVRGKKKKSIGSIMYSTHSMDFLLDEVAKCDVVCANCHRRRTYRRAGSWRSLEVEAEAS